MLGYHPGGFAAGRNSHKPRLLLIRQFESNPTHETMKTPHLLILAGLAVASLANAALLDIDGSLGEFPNYLLSDNASDIPDASQTDGTVTLTLRDDSVLKWSNSGFPLFAQSEINFQPGYDGSDATIGLSSDLTQAITKGTFYTVNVASTSPIDITNITLRFNRHDSGSPRRFYILDDADNNGHDVGDVIVETGPTLLGSTDVSTQTLSVNPGTSNVTSYDFHFYISNTPNGAGNVHWTYASVDYTVVPEPAVFAALVGLVSFSFLLWQRRKQPVSGK
jgi:hypothetical protein